MTHAGGLVSKTYRVDMLKLGFEEKDIPKEGEILVVNDRYMRRAIARIFQMGYFIGHLVWQHLQKDSHDESIKLISITHTIFLLRTTRRFVEGCANLG